MAICVAIFVSLLIIIGTFFSLDFMNEIDNREEKQKNEEHEKTELKTLTTEQIKEIHLKGMLTPAEKVQEWESNDLCAPGDAIGSAASRCKKFHHKCHDCLVDYANQNNEYEPIDFKVTNK